MRNVYYIKEDNSAVQDYYAGIIADALLRNGYFPVKAITYNEVSGLSKDTVVICISHYIVSKLILKGYKNCLYWVQGSSPDESYMRNHSKLRRFVISVIERFALGRCKACFMVSQSMVNYYNRKYKKDFSYKTYIMPCYNSQIEEKLFNKEGKYINNVFCYVGGLSVWQCFNETVRLYSKIEKKVPGAFLKVYTAEIDKAKSVLKTEGVKNYSVEFVKSNELVGKLSECKYGFILRRESPVNLVATPTKLSNYLAAGLIPIVSTAVGFFNEILSDTKYKVLLNTFDDTDSIKRIASLEIDKDDILNEYKHLFKKYYNTNQHIDKISEFLKTRGFYVQ